MNNYSIDPSNKPLQQAVFDLTQRPNLTKQQIQQLQQRLQPNASADEKTVDSEVDKASAGKTSASAASASTATTSRANTSTASNEPRFNLKAFAASLAFLAVFATTVWFYGLEETPSEPATSEWSYVVDKASISVAQQHIQPKPLEAKTNQFAALVQHFAMLDFKLIEPVDMLSTGQWELLGGRYCTLLGQDAAQIRLKEVATGKVHSLYQAKLTPSQAAKAPPEGKTYASVDGVRMKFWMDDGVLCAITIN